MAGEAIIDFAGVASIRVDGATATEVGRLAGNIGGKVRQNDLDGFCDVRLSLGADLLDRPVWRLGRSRYAFSDRAFLVLDPLTDRPVAAIDRQTPAPPFAVAAVDPDAASPLVAWAVDLTLRRRGILRVDGASFVQGGATVAVSGWSGGGKTGTLLAFVAQGARLVGAERLYLDPRTKSSTSPDDAVRVRRWHVEEPSKWLGRRARIRVAATSRLLEATRQAGVLPLPNAARQMATIVRDRLDSHSAAAVAARHFGPPAVSPVPLPNFVFLIFEGSTPGVSVEPCSPADAATRLLAYRQANDIADRQLSLRFAFAFPEAAEAILADDRASEFERLRDALADARSFTVRKGASVDPRQLHTAIAPLVSGA